MKKPARFLIMVLIFALALGVIGAQAQESKVLRTGLNMGAGDAETIDPSVATTVKEIQLIDEMFIGMVHLNELTTELDAGLASDWTISDDGTVFTFNITPEIPWVRYNAESGAVEMVMDESGNPRYVTAEDVVYGIKRTLDPTTAGDYAYVLAPYVVGGEAYYTEDGSPDDVGVKALDTYTVEITAPEATGFTLNIYSLWMSRPMPSWSIEEFGDSWTEPENISTNGPWALKEWVHDESLTLIKNPFWKGTDGIPAPMLDEVVFVFQDEETQFAEYQAGTLDASLVPLADIDRIKADPVLSQEFTQGFDSCVYYYGFDVTEEPVNNVHLRRALSYAVDRQSVVDNVTKGGQIGAQWFSRPGLAAAPTLETNPDLGITYDPDMAKAELEIALEEMGYASAADIPPITLAYNDRQSHATIAQAIQQMWTDTLGVQVALTGLEPTTYFTVIGEEAPAIFRAGWCMDYPDANNYLYDVFRSDSAQNDTGFANDQYDALIDEARVLTDQEARRELYAQAEEILNVDEAAIIPIYWYVSLQLSKPNLERTYSLIGIERYEKWDISN